MNEKNISSAPKISVLMPAYNVELFVVEAIESILNQTFSDFELIIIDDYSTDKTWEILQEYATKDKRVTLYRNEKNLGISKTRNKLIEFAKAKYVVWQDADDISFPYRLGHQYAFMELHPEIGISAGYLEFFDEKGAQSIRKYFPDDARLRTKIFRYSPVPQPAAIIRKVVFEDTGYFPVASPVAEDLAMTFQIGTKYKFGNLEEVLIRYRQNHSGVTFTKLHTMELYTIFLRYYYSHNTSYKATLGDKIYNFIQYLTIFLIPTRFKIWLFNLIRNS